jgi:spore maturation protein CgeB
MINYLYSMRPVSNIDQSFKRYGYQGDYEYAYRKGWLQVLSDTSYVYSQIRSKIGVPTLYAPWGASQRWYEDLGLERDIDVLWMGKRGSQRRSRILDQVFRELKSKGLNVYIGDNEENPFIFGKERIRHLNRAKITLNITRTWYDDNFSRFTMACSNRSLVVSEPVLSHCIEFKKNIHYVSAKIEDLPNTIIYYLEHEEERKQIVDNAYNLMISDLTFENSLRKMSN